MSLFLHFYPFPLIWWRNYRKNQLHYCSSCWRQCIQFFFSAVTSYNLIVCPKQLDSIQPSHSAHQIYTLRPYLAAQTLADSELSSSNSAPDGPFALSTCSGHSFNYDFYLRISMKSYQSTVINSSGCHISSFRDHLTPNSSNILSQT